MQTISGMGVMIAEKMPSGNDTPRYFSHEGSVRYYSLARYALLEALQLAGIGHGSKVLLPTYVCRDLLAPIAMLGATPVWYDVSESLNPQQDASDWPVADAVLAIDYFGFPQNLEPFMTYTARTGAILIEDNAHGYLSRAEDGRWLGTRGDLGLFSFRKTLRLPDGAALLVSHPKCAVKLPAQLPFDGKGFNSAQTIKARLRSAPLIGDLLLRLSTSMARTIRKLRSGDATPQPDPTSERELPTAPVPWYGLMHELNNCNVAFEINRRRRAYLQCAETGERAGVTPVFTDLPAGCAPYAYAFRGPASGIDIMRQLSEQLGFDFVTWPDLPGTVKKTAPVYYHNVFLINFLW